MYSQLTKSQFSLLHTLLLFWLWLAASLQPIGHQVFTRRSSQGFLFDILPNYQWSHYKTTWMFFISLMRSRPWFLTLPTSLHRGKTGQQSITWTPGATAGPSPQAELVVSRPLPMKTRPARVGGCSRAGNRASWTQVCGMVVTTGVRLVHTLQKLINFPTHLFYLIISPKYAWFGRLKS